MYKSKGDHPHSRKTMGICLLWKTLIKYRIIWAYNMLNDPTDRGLTERRLATL